MPDTTTLPDLPPETSAREAVRSPEFWSDIYNGNAAPAPEVVETDTQAATTTTTAERPRDEKGRFVKTAQEQADADAAAAVSANGDGSPDTPPVDPEALQDAADPEAAKEPEPEAKKPITAFTAYDPEGEIALPDNLEVEFKANGEVRRMPLDKAIRLAQSGYYNEQLQTEVKSSRETRAQLEAQVQDLTRRFQMQAELNRQMLLDENAYLANREQYQQMHSPEARAARAEQELNAFRQQQMIAQQTQQAASFHEQVLTPKVAALLSQYPTVTDAEAAGWLAPELKALEVNGTIPPYRYPDLVRLLETDLGPWMAQQHLQRSESSKASETKRAAEIRRLQVESTKAKRELTRAVAPSKAPGTTGTPSTAQDEDHMSARDLSKKMFREMGFTR